MVATAKPTICRENSMLPTYHSSVARIQDFNSYCHVLNPQARNQSISSHCI